MEVLDMDEIYNSISGSFKKPKKEENPFEDLFNAFSKKKRENP